jgi:hypothetical protein
MHPPFCFLNSPQNGGKLSQGELEHFRRAIANFYFKSLFLVTLVLLLRHKLTRPPSGFI